MPACTKMGGAVIYGTVWRLPLPGGDTSVEDLLEPGLTSDDWLIAAGILLGAIAAAIAANRIARSIVSRSVGAGFAAIMTARVIGYLIFLVGLVYALSRLGVRVGPLLGALGISGLILALALQKVVENFFGSVILQARRPFTPGDTVQLGDHVGVVTDIDARTVVLRRLDGSMVRIPNLEVLNHAIVNLTREPARRSELVVGVAYGTDLNAATRVITQAVGRVPRIRAAPAPQILLSSFGSSSIDITVYYWHASDVPSELAATNDLVVAVHHALADAGITIAFPQLVVWPGRDDSSNPYVDAPGLVYSDQPAAPARRAEPAVAANTPDEQPHRRRRLPWRREPSA